MPGQLSKRITQRGEPQCQVLRLSVCATHGLCYWISIVDASQGVVFTENNGGGQTQKEMLLDPSQEQKHHRGSWWQFSHFCQKQISTWITDNAAQNDQTYWDAPIHIHLRQDWRHWWRNSWEWEWLLLSRPFCRGRNFHVSMFSGNISDVGIIHLGDRLLSFSQVAYQSAF